MHKDTFVKQQRWSIKYKQIIDVFACVCGIYMMRSMWSIYYDGKKATSLKLHKTWLQLSLQEADRGQEAEVGLPALALVPGSGVRGLHCLCEASVKQQALGRSGLCLWRQSLSLRHSPTTTTHLPRARCLTASNGHLDTQRHTHKHVGTQRHTQKRLDTQRHKHKH